MVTETRVLRAHSQKHEPSGTGSELHHSREKPVGKRAEFSAICMEKLDSSTRTPHPSCSENGLIGLVLKAGN